MFSPEKKEAEKEVLIPSQKVENATGNPLEDYQIGDALGAFSAYNRRPKATSMGLTAAFFGENGVDADVISALHLTHYQDLPAKVTVWMIKDKNGKVIKRNGRQPKITEFIASIKRPKPSGNGQTALFFGANGINADSINILNQTEYLDAFVFIDIQLADENILARDIVTIEPLKEIEKEAEKLTPAEIKQISKLQKVAKDADKILVMSGFYTNESILRVIGNEEDYRKWVEAQSCCHPGSRPCDHSEVNAYYFNDGRSKYYQFIPLCKEHSEEWDTGSVPGVTDLLTFFQSRRKSLLAVWAKETLRQKLNIPADYEIPPSTLYHWVCENNLNKYLNPTYLNFI